LTAFATVDAAGGEAGEAGAAAGSACAEAAPSASKTSAMNMVRVNIKRSLLFLFSRAIQRWNI
jgi:hypothetical protein